MLINRIVLYLLTYVIVKLSVLYVGFKISIELIFYMINCFRYICQCVI